MLRVVGAGMGRTGTFSLKTALERLLGAPCYHMVEVFQHPEHIAAWHAAGQGKMPDWHQLLDGYAGAVDWPSAAFWPELIEAFPEALVVLSLRDPEAWWQSTQETIFYGLGNGPMPPGWLEMIETIFESRFTKEIRDRGACIAAYERNIERVRATVPTSRLLEWNVQEGWEPLCGALGVSVPNEPFPRMNTREEWAARRASE